MPNKAHPKETSDWAELIEKLAAIEHKRWSDWHQHAYDNWTPVNITRWNEQAKTEYKDLPEPTKELDRREVRRYFPLIAQALRSVEERRKKLDADIVMQTPIVEAESYFEARSRFRERILSARLGDGEQ